MNKHDRTWSLQEAKAKFSEVVRLAQSEGPQTVTVHGKPAVVIEAVADKVVAGEELTGRDFVQALGTGHKFDLDLPERPADGEFRDVKL